MNITGCTKSDYDQIVSDVSGFWGHDRIRALHHPMFVNEFGDCAYVVRDGENVVAYLFGFIASAEPVAYIHLVAVRPSHRHLGLGRQLYGHFTSVAVSRGCRQLRAITTPHNAGSIRFHRSLGFHLEGAPNADGVPVVRDYAGPGADRVVFRKSLDASDRDPRADQVIE
jgi:GNAT superfamily N-acetyltransferase